MYKVIGWLGSLDEQFSKNLGCDTPEKASAIFQDMALMAAIAYREWHMELIQTSDNKVLSVDGHNSEVV